MQSFGTRSVRRAFTLIELLVVIAIIAILAAILFPVFAQAKAAAYKTQDISNFKQVGTATAMYLGDNDGRYFMSDSGGLCSQVIGWGYTPPDTVPGVVLSPYVKNTQVFVCPVDPNKSEDARIRAHITDTGLGWNYNTLTPAQKLYAMMVRSNMGYNYAFLSPWRYITGQPGGSICGSGTVSESEINGTATTIAFASSIWDRDYNSGAPKGGGNWVVETPCWQDAAGAYLRPLAQYDADGTLFSYPSGWATPTRPPGSSGWIVYGGLWPWHNQQSLASISPGLVDGQVITMMCDSSVKSRPIKRLTEGCSAYGTGVRKGTMTDTSKFIWDLD